MKTNWLTRLLVIVGTILVGLPVVAPIVFAFVSLAGGNGFMLDYLMPAELSIMVLMGAGLLIWAAIRAKTLLKPIAWILGVSVLMLFGCQGLAEISGLANGSREPSGPVFIIVMAMLVLYDLGVVTLAVLGGMLIKKAFSSVK